MASPQLKIINTSLILICCLILRVRGFSSGPPTSVCIDMTPQHGISPQTVASPFTLTFSSNCYTAGERLTVTLAGPQFEGFFVQARVAGSTFPTFDTNGNSGYKLIGCPGSRSGSASASAVGHSNSNGKTSVTVGYTPPMPSLKSNINFTYTVAQDYTTYWVQQVASLPECVQPTTTTSTTTTTTTTPTTTTTTSTTTTTTTTTTTSTTTTTTTTTPSTTTTTTRTTTTSTPITTTTTTRTTTTSTPSTTTTTTRTTTTSTAPIPTTTTSTATTTTISVPLPGNCVANAGSANYCATINRNQCYDNNNVQMCCYTCALHKATYTAELNSVGRQPNPNCEYGNRIAICGFISPRLCGIGYYATECCEQC